ncbi:MAG TPA: uroporphyrinogen decarboxylase family protein [Candidatus Hydrogenedentes bacterium]|nr:uroporphyrinogen decarboxylase family protein [Candidatus Hydrogenedentota bacterium]HOL76542.1 uroporphyrinogen decarboxylase family protein [Candidatus Hydrogenedentota bacterium]HPO85206.1 uroporphyrinogen decarboxylase family protein [Candidatus Hydrogenedentota bacterium]
MGRSITSRERVERTIHFAEPDRVPFNFWMDRRRMAELETKYGAEFRVRHYGADLIESYGSMPPFPHAEYVVREGTAWMVREAFDDWREAKNLPMPDPLQPSIYEMLNDHLRNFPHHAIIVNSPGVLTILEMMRRQENIYVDMLSYPEEVKDLFERISSVMAIIAEQVCQRDITALYIQDDIAYNNGLIVSIETIREFLLPYWKKVADVAHAYGKPVFFHSDGKVDAVYDLLYKDLGVCMLNPLQPELQNIAQFKEEYNGKMGLYGGIATARFHTMAPDEIRRHVFDLFEQAGRGGGLIMSSHDIDYAVTEEQINAYVEAVKACRYV